MPPYTIFILPLLSLVHGVSKSACPTRSILYCNCYSGFYENYHDGKVQVDCSKAGSDEEIAVSLKNISWPSTEIWEFKIYKNSRVLKLPVGILGDLTLQSIWIGITTVRSIHPLVILPSEDRLINFTLQDSRLEEFPFHIIPRLRSLENLWLRNNSLTSVPSLRSESLQAVNLDYNQIATFEEGRWVTPELRVLDISYNPLSSFPSAVIKDMQKLEKFYCSGCNLGPTLLMGQLEFRSKTLKLVSLRENSISRLEPAAIGGINADTTVDLTWNNITILDENAFRPILEIMSLGDGLLLIDYNPIHCDCTLDWLALAPALMKKLKGTCTNGTDLRDLNLLDFQRPCCLYPNTCVNAKLEFLCIPGKDILSNTSNCYMEELCCEKDLPKTSFTDATFIAATSVVAIIIVIITISSIFYYRLRKEQARKITLPKKETERFRRGEPMNINPTLSLSEQADLLPYDEHWEFPAKRLRLGEELGRGTFGIAIKAVARGIRPSEPETTVVVKKSKPHGDLVHFKKLMMEMKIMSHLGKHLNVVNFLGACSENMVDGDLMVIVEYCRHGNLEHLLRKYRSNFKNGIDHHTGNKTKIGEQCLQADAHLLPGREHGQGMETNIGKKGEISKGINLLASFTREDLVSWAYQISQGMEYLSSRKIVHRDLAARNILLAEENVLKISNFGYARDIHVNNQYNKEGDGPVPYKWMALESLIHEKVYTNKSDVWAYGITLWEIFTLGKTPYTGMKFGELIQRLQADYRLESPDYANEHIYQIMRKCWEANPNDRPTFSLLSVWFASMMVDGERQRILELNKSYEEMNAEHFKAHPDYLQRMAPGGFEEEYLQPRGLTLDLQKESSVFVPDNDNPEYFEIDEDFKSKIFNNVPKNEIRDSQYPRMETDEIRGDTFE